MLIESRKKAIPLPAAILCGIYVCFFGFAMVVIASHIGTPVREGMVAPYQIISDLIASAMSAIVVILALNLAFFGRSQYRRYLTISLIASFLTVLAVGMYDSFHENILQSSRNRSTYELIDFFWFALRWELNAAVISIFSVIALLHFAILYKIESAKQFFDNPRDA